MKILPINNSNNNSTFRGSIDKSVIKMYEKKITHMGVDKYRHLAFQIDQFYKTNGYIDTADLITYLESDLESIKTSIREKWENNDVLRSDFILCYEPFFFIMIVVIGLSFFCQRTHGA
mgnify:CR=1 FL=1